MKRVVFKIVEPNQYQCKKCCAIFSGGQKPPEECPQCERASDFKIITEGIDVPKNLWKMPLWTDIDPDMFNTYIDLVNLFKKNDKIRGRNTL